MHRNVLLWIAWFGLAAVAVAAPARPLYEPPDPPNLAAPKFVDLNGTAWLGKYNTINRIYTPRGEV